VPYKGIRRVAGRASTWREIEDLVKQRLHRTVRDVEMALGTFVLARLAEVRELTTMDARQLAMA
jgi:hypothetical protein